MRLIVEKMVEVILGDTHGLFCFLMEFQMVLLDCGRTLKCSIKFYRGIDDLTCVGLCTVNILVVHLLVLPDSDQLMKRVH